MTSPDPVPAPPRPLEPPLSPAEFDRFSIVTRALPAAWLLTVRRRRLLLLALAAPGFLALTTTPIHRNLVLLTTGASLFAAAFGFRRFCEGAFVRAEAAALWPPSPAPRPDPGHA